MAAPRTRQYRALALMYFAQGLPSGLAFNALGVLIRQGSHDVSAVGWTGLAFLPWALKFIWAGAIDNLCARRGYAPVVMATQTLAVLVCLALTAFPPSTALGMALAGVVLLNTICATQDIATNAYAVTHLQGKGAGAANAIQVAGFIAGMLCGGGGLLVVHEHYGWRVAMCSMAALFVALYLPLLLDREWRRDAGGVAGAGAVPKAGGRHKIRLRDLRQHPDLLAALAVALLFKFAGTAVATLVQPWLVDRGMDGAAIGALQMAMLVSTAVGGVVLGIPMVRRFGNARAAWIASALAAAVLGVPWLLQSADVHDSVLLYVAFCGQAVFEGAMYVAIWAMFMNWADPARPGTDYTAMQCCESLANAVGAGAIGGLGQRLGYANAFGAMWLAGIVAVLLIVMALGRMRFVAASDNAGEVA